mmetsp:Transcript_24651/g.37455  ORF Transcript_24651/g.37455 Transcript_24651/m.37455 type:complete len:471 (-) Transcript_24651:1023-2435(-)
MEVDSDDVKVVPENQKAGVGIELAPSGIKTSINLVDMFVAFSAPLVQEMVASRLTPTYIGVRRQRPSNPLVQSAWKNSNDSENQNTTPTTNVSFFCLDESGKKRRMTKKEKKALKNKLRLEKKELKGKRKLSENSNGTTREEKDDSMSGTIDGLVEEHKETTSCQTGTEENISKTKCDENLSLKVENNYHHFTVDSTALEQELADLRGERDSVPPVSLMPAMMMEAQRSLKLSPFSERRRALRCTFDEDLSTKWAREIRSSLSDSEKVRNEEDMRPMAYQLVPEAWNRLRPVGLFTKDGGSRDEHDFSKGMSFQHKSTSNHDVEHEWSRMSLRHEMDNLDVDKSTIFSLLMSQTDLHIACGAKFGSDFLLYDGPRNERHAFAGLRVLNSLPQEVPTPYDLHGYVRCLNTAGKLSLLAKVDRNTDHGNTIKVAIVDLALEKILSAPRHSWRSVTKARREVGKNLAKRKKTS